MNNYTITTQLLDFLKSNNCTFLLNEIDQAQVLPFIKDEKVQIWKLQRKHKNKFLLEIQNSNHDKIAQFFYTLEKISINKLLIRFENQILNFSSSK